jgi:hypothetical protein
VKREKTRSRALAVSLLVACATWQPELNPWRLQASELRGLDFKRPVPLYWASPRELPGLVRDELDAMIDPEYAIAYRDAFAALGLIPPDLDLVDVLVRLNQEQIAGFYSVRRRTMFVVTGGAVPGLAPELPIEQAGVVIHELVHALQHQHFPGTLELMQGLRHNDDVVLALGAAAEGDAMLTMLRSGQRDGKLSETAVELMRARLRHDLANPAGLLAEVPRIVRLSLLFPYVAGFELAARRYRADGSAGLDAMLREPPLSSQAVSSPDVAAAVEFVRLPAQRAAELAGPGCRPGHDNVAGALGVEALLADHAGPEASDRFEQTWRGDRFLHVACPGGAELLWITRWATREDAASFAAAYASIAPRVASVAPLAGVPRVETRDRGVLVFTPRLAAGIDELFASTEARSYASLGQWLADDCFPESPCPD